MEAGEALANFYGGDGGARVTFFFGIFQVPFQELKDLREYTGPGLPGYPVQ